MEMRLRLVVGVALTSLAGSLLPVADAQDTNLPTVTVTAARDPVDKSYRKMIRGMDLFEQNRQRAAAGASLRFKLLPRRTDTDMNRIAMEIAGETVAIPIRVASADNTFTLERIQKAWDEDASVRSNRRNQTMTWRAEIRTPGQAPNVRRLGDMRLECMVGVEAELISATRQARPLDFLFGRPDYCNRPKPRYLFFSEKPIFSVTLTSGARRETLTADMMWADVGHPDSKEELPYCDCEVLLDRTYFLPLGDRSWPDDTLVELEFMDDAMRAGPPLPPGRVAAQRAQGAIAPGSTTKRDVFAALGNAMAIRFDSGYEVWVYRVKEPPPVPQGKERSRNAEPLPPPLESELTILFAPTGVATKTRVLALPV
jgi:hypothetical protein